MFKINHSSMENGHFVSDNLGRQKENLIHLWKARIHHKNPKGKNDDLEVIGENLPGFLDDIIENLKNPGHRISSETIAKGFISKLKNVSLDQIISEYETLKEAILEILTRDGQSLDEISKTIIVEDIFIGICTATKEYGLIQEASYDEFEKDLLKKVRHEIDEKIKLETFLDSLPVGVLLIEKATAEILFINKAGNELNLDRFPNEFLSDNQDDYYAVDSSGTRIPFNDLPRFRAARGEKLKGYEMTAIYPEGSTTMVIHSDILKGLKGEPERIMLVVQEIQERKKKEMSQLEETNALKEEKEIRDMFVSSMTHDLRTPLSVARISAEIMKNKVDDEVVQKNTNRIIQSIERADQMIRDLLDSTTLKFGQKIPLQRDMINLKDVVENTISQMIQLHGNRFQLYAPENVRGFWSSKGVQRILENLCSNAVKYGNHKPIQISLTQDDHSAFLSVTNKGRLISETEQLTIFNPFKRSVNDMSLRPEGWGIGLYLVKGLTEAHDGRVSVESTREKGTVFTIQLPKG